MIPGIELKTQYLQIQDELEAAVLKALRSCHFVLGPEVEAFEKEFAAWNGNKYGIGVANGTDALQLALRALGVGLGDEVICPSFTFVASAGAAALTGATPIFADVDPVTFTLDVESLRKSITPKTKAVVAVHLYGHPAPIKEIKAICDEKGIGLVEDCAQAAGCELDGQRVGTFGDFGCYSFYPTKNLSAAGDGGIVVTNSEEHRDKILMLRGHGSSKRYYHDILGTNSRLDEIQAAVLRVKLKYVDGWNEKRRAAAKLYNELLADTYVTTPSEMPGCRHVYHQYTILTPDRDALQKHLQENGVGSCIYYPVSLHLQKTFASSGMGEGSLPICERIQQQCLSLPMFPELSEEQIKTVADAIKSFTPKMD